MHTGIIRIKDNIIYIDIENNKLNCYRYVNGQKVPISNELIINIMQYIITCHKPKLLSTTDYTVYLDTQTGYKHFYKNNQEDFIKFFYENGKSALLFNKNKQDKNNLKPLNFALLGIDIVLILSSFIFITNIVNNRQTTQNTSQTNLTSNIEYSEPIGYVDNSFFINYINDSNCLTDSEKQLLINNKLFDDISQTKMTADRIFSLETKLTNINIVVGEEGKPGPNVLGWYNPLISNQIFVVNANDNPTTTHEFVHLLQDDNKYTYIREACATIISNEYYDANSNSYPNEVIRTKFLMELIGPDVIWNLNFSGSTIEFENTIKDILPKEDADKLLELFSSSPGKFTPDMENHINSEIDNYLKEIYTNLYPDSKDTIDFLTSISNNQKLSSTDYLNSHNYFQKEEKENADNKFMYKFFIPVNTALQNNLVDISFSITKKIPVDLNTNTNDEIIHEEYTILNHNLSQVIDENGTYFVSLIDGTSYTPKEAQNLGYIEVNYYKYEYLYEVSINDIEQYKNIPNIAISKPQITVLSPYNIQGVFAETYTNANDNTDIVNISINYQTKDALYKNTSSKTR